jgi:hypothetical protein
MEQQVAALDGVANVNVNIVWEGRAKHKIGVAYRRRFLNWRR